MAARAPAGGEHGGAAAEGEAKLASAKTRSDYEHAVKRLEGMNLNLKLRVAQLEEELEHDSTAGADASAQPSMDHGPAAEASAQPSTTACTLGEDAASARVSADLEKRREALDGEWEAVQKLHEEVAALKMDLEMGKLPAEPAVRRKAFLAKHTALQDKVGLLESEMRGLRQNCKEARRLQEHAEARALDAAKELDAARQHAKGLEDAVEGLTKRAADAEAELAAATAAEVVAVAGVNGGLSEEGAGGGQVVMYLEKVLSLEQRLAEQVRAPGSRVPAPESSKNVKYSSGNCDCRVWACWDCSATSQVGADSQIDPYRLRSFDSSSGARMRWRRARASWSASLPSARLVGRVERWGGGWV